MPEAGAGARGAILGEGASKPPGEGSGRRGSRCRRRDGHFRFGAHLAGYVPPAELKAAEFGGGGIGGLWMFFCCVPGRVQREGPPRVGHPWICVGRTSSCGCVSVR